MRDEHAPGRDDELEDLLARAARAERDERAAADALRDAPGEARVARTLEGLWQTSASSASSASLAPPTRPRAWLFGVLALAASVLVLFFLTRSDPDRAPTPRGDYLGPEGQGVLAPAGYVTSWPAEITWKAVEGAREYAVRVRVDDGASQELDLGRTRETRIEFPSELRARAVRIEIEVEAWLSDGAPRRMSQWSERRP